MPDEIYPLRQVVDVWPTGREGKQISPHSFWRNVEFTARLECGHEQTRSKSDYKGVLKKYQCWRSRTLSAATNASLCPP